MARFYPVTVEIEGRRYAGDWELRQGGEVYVRCPAYGTLSAPAGQSKPEAVAADTLRKIVKAWRLKQDREARQIARETERVARTGRAQKPRARP